MKIVRALMPIVLTIASSASAQATIPFCPGVTIVSAVNDIKGDYESIVSIESIEKDRVNLAYSADIVMPNSISLVTAKRTVLISDMSNARLMHNWFSQNSAKAYPGTTSLQTSVAVLRNLKSKGEADIGLLDRGNSEMSPSRSSHPNIFEFERVYKLHRTSSSPVMMAIVINDAVVNVPTVTAAGENMGDQVEFSFMDDPLHPLSLQFKLALLGGKPIASRVVKVSHRCSAAQLAASNAKMSQIEKSLLESRKADVYQIYFDFNSDRIREQSAPSLKEIADILKRHADWKLAINGHTDNIGGDAYNLDLSRRRAASVKAELVSHYAIAGGRLSTGGAGASQPKATNATLEGRAQNRRVELIRTSP